MTKDAAEMMGVQNGELFATRELKLQPIMLDKDKTRPHGFDAVYRNPKTGNLVVVEFKGGKGKLKKYQKEADYMIKVAEKSIKADNSSAIEKKSSEMVKADLDKGKTVEYMAISTPKWGKPSVVHHSFAVKAANSQDIQRPKLNHKKFTELHRGTIHGWQKPPMRAISRPANDNNPSPRPKQPSQTSSRNANDNKPTQTKPQSISHSQSQSRRR